MTCQPVYDPFMTDRPVYDRPTRLWHNYDTLITHFFTKLVKRVDTLTQRVNTPTKWIDKTIRIAKPSLNGSILG
jgi:hypothetical protein